MLIMVHESAASPLIIHHYFVLYIRVTAFCQSITSVLTIPRLNGRIIAIYLMQ